jgi:hypothetical protein
LQFYLLGDSTARNLLDQLDARFAADPVGWNNDREEQFRAKGKGSVTLQLGSGAYVAYKKADQLAHWGAGSNLDTYLDDIIDDRPAFVALSNEFHSLMGDARVHHNHATVDQQVATIRNEYLHFEETIGALSRRHYSGVLLLLELPSPQTLSFEHAGFRHYAIQNRNLYHHCLYRHIILPLMTRVRALGLSILFVPQAQLTYPLGDWCSDGVHYNQCDSAGYIAVSNRVVAVMDSLTKTCSMRNHSKNKFDSECVNQHLAEWERYQNKRGENVCANLFG